MENKITSSIGLRWDLTEDEYTEFKILMIRRGTSINKWFKDQVHKELKNANNA
jgi:hypothetical protein